ncbi:GIY-YIG nuclease family protein [Paenibacillus aquistagni]|uniref:GIY-YIG catalytic domain-containing protein n=1 Tax=Paenibacillus aquistagni TaxID=1852522 RepID=A0A1X7LEE5_9BACL|nr:GIY-YIG nuclease family protein [Paenibacillus aquistagni]SMG52218.1 hypothetical protein SAMN06295960_3372 [Paenibacillus aquistagni]
MKLRNKEGGFKLTFDNYIKISNKDITPSYEELESKLKTALTNLDLNIKFFKSLSWGKFNDELCKLVDSSNFDEITDLNLVCGVKGFYIMVLDDYCQIYIGIAKNIRRRIREHWSTQIPLNKLVVKHLQDNRLSIDSFRELDTTRIFVRPCPECDFDNYPLISGNLEDQLIRQFPSDYCMNKSYGGWSLKEILEAKERRKKALESISSDYE